MITSVPRLWPLRLVAALALGWCGGAVVFAGEERLLVVGLTASEPGYVAPGQAHAVSRYEADLALAVARTQGFRVAFQLAPLEDLLREMDEGRIDLMPHMARTVERQRRFDFTVAHTRMNTNLFARREPGAPQSTADLAGRKIAVVRDGFSQRWLEEQGHGDRLVLVPDVDDALRQLSEGKADAMLATQFATYAAMRTLGIRNVVMVGPPVAELYREHCMVVRLGNRELLAHLNEGLFTLKQTGELDAIHEKWFGVLETDTVSFARVTRYVGFGAALLVLLAGAAWIRHRSQSRRAQERLAEFEERVAQRTEELAAAKARFEAVVAGTPAGVVLIDPHDADVIGRIYDCNGFTGRMHGYFREELIGASFNCLRVDPFTREQLAEIVEHARQGHRRHGHAQHRHRDGSVIEVEFYTTLISIEGRELLLTIDLDVTDRLRAENALRRTGEFQRLVLEATNDGIFEWDVVANRFYLSPRAKQMLGFEEDELPGQRLGWFQRLHPDDVEAAEAALWRHITYRASFVHTARFLHKDGSVRWLYCRAHTLRNDQGEPVRMVGAYTDITELKRIDEELQLSRRVRAMGELVGGIAHEFNNLLTPILLQTSLLTELSSTPPAIVSELNSVIAAARRAQTLTQRLLQFGRRRDSGTEPQPLMSVVESTVSLLRATIDRRIHLDIQPDGTLPPVQFNSAMLGQAVMNLLLNARDAVQERAADAPADWQPRIQISLTRHRGAVRPTRDVGPRRWQRLTIRDNGIGMSAAVRERVFEPFFTTKSVGHGTGLGLSMVWTTVTELGGWVEVESQENVGTAFHMHLPDGDDSSEASRTESIATKAALTPPPKPSSSASAGSDRRRILLVDDDALVGETTTSLLKHLGHEVVWLRSGDAALPRLEPNGEAWDLVISDLNMPGIGGEDLVARARAGGYRGKIVVVSGYVTTQTETRLRELGVEGVLKKPFEFVRFKTFLAELWQKK